MHFVEELKQQGAQWVRSQNFWLFGTATFKNGAVVAETEAVADAKHFFNMLDRSVLTRKQIAQGTRLDRLVFLEHGKFGANTHIHFFIKGTELKQYKVIAHSAELLWRERIEKANDLVILDNIGLDNTRSEYCWKEVKAHQRDVLLIECCHLSEI
jgi:hypothetical protein